MKPNTKVVNAAPQNNLTITLQDSVVSEEQHDVVGELEGVGEGQQPQVNTAQQKKPAKRKRKARRGGKKAIHETADKVGCTSLCVQSCSTRLHAFASVLCKS